MNRQIEFRVWNERDKEFEKTTSLECDGEGKLIVWSADRHHCKISQFTELFDVKEKKIFDGDILRYVEFHLYRNNQIGVVEVHMGPYGATFYKNGKIFHLMNYLVGLSCTSFEIIGNIFENPELVHKS